MTKQLVRNQDLASDVYRRNQIVNGGIEHWQRGNGPFTGNNIYAADRWTSSLNGTSTLSVSKDTTNQDSGSGACAALTYVHNTTSQWYQKFEDYLQLRGRTITLSMRVKTSVAGAVRLWLDGAATRTLGAYHTGSGNYETLTVTATILAAATAVQGGVQLEATCNPFVDNAMLVYGPVTPDYIPMPPADDLARSLRYYEQIGVSSSADVVVRGWCGVNSEALNISLLYRAIKPITATVTKVGTWAVSNAGQPTIVGATTSGFRLEITATTSGSEAYGINNGGGQYITAEANP